MKPRNFTLPALFGLALAACQQPADDSNIAIDNNINAAEAAEADVEALPPSEESGAPVESNSGSGRDETAMSAASIPAQYRGRWGLVAADCTSTRGAPAVDRGGLRPPSCCT